MKSTECNFALSFSTWPESINQSLKFEKLIARRNTVAVPGAFEFWLSIFY